MGVASCGSWSGGGGRVRPGGSWSGGGGRVQVMVLGGRVGGGASGGSWSGGVSSGCSWFRGVGQMAYGLPPVNRITNRSEHITLPRSRYVICNYFLKWQLQWNLSRCCWFAKGVRTDFLTQLRKIKKPARIFPLTLSILSRDFPEVVILWMWEINGRCTVI